MQTIVFDLSEADLAPDLAGTPASQLRVLVELSPDGQAYLKARSTEWRALWSAPLKGEVQS